MKNNNKKHFWNWGDDASSRELFLYGTIAEESWFEDVVTPEMFRSELMSGTGPVTVWLSSPGGDCIAASQIYSMLMDYPFDVTVKIDGIAASAASVVAMAGTTVLMAPTSCIMIHDPMTVAMGNEGDMEKAIDMLKAVKDSIITAYEIKTGMSRAEISKLMSAETWMDCNKAIELGFADGILQKNDVSPVADQKEPILFSQRSTDLCLMNKLAVSVGIPVKPLYERLQNLKNETTG
ncbi:MAG: Clp protease ClpP [Clostridia bacterium]|nr:Clp protease ClpP [Clostridia bacterium]